MIGTSAMKELIVVSSITVSKIYSSMVYLMSSLVCLAKEAKYYY